MILVTNEVDGFVSTDIKTVLVTGEVYEMIDTDNIDFQMGQPYGLFGIFSKLFKTPLHNELVSLNDYEIAKHFYTEQETRDILIQDVLN